jgi:hypothetical protein
VLQSAWDEKHEGNMAFCSGLVRPREKMMYASLNMPVVRGGGEECVVRQGAMVQSCCSYDFQSDMVRPREKMT